MEILGLLDASGPLCDELRAVVYRIALNGIVTAVVMIICLIIIVVINKRSKQKMGQSEESGRKGE